MEIAPLLPERIPSLLGGGVIVLFGKFVGVESVDMEISGQWQWAVVVDGRQWAAGSEPACIVSPRGPEAKQSA